MTAEFDRHAGTYVQSLEATLGRLGGESAYYAASKARYVARLVGPAFDGAILDFGCGVGLLSSALGALAPRARVDGYDPSAASLAEVPADVRAAGRFTTDLADLPASYALVVVANVLHHVEPAARPATVAAIAARLAPGGRVVVFEHNPHNPATRALVASCPFDEGVVLLRRREVAALLSAAGLAVERRDYVTFFPPALGALRPLEPALAALPLGAQHAVVARR